MARPPHTHLRLIPASTESAWRLHAMCRSLGDYLSFAPDGERAGARARREQAAKAICSTCPVTDQCRHHALATDEPHGLWGGLSEAERRFTSNYSKVSA